MRTIVYAVLAILAAACADTNHSGTPARDLDPLAERYVRLALANLLSYPPAPVLFKSE